MLMLEKHFLRRIDQCYFTQAFKIYIYIRAKGRKEEGERVSPGHYWAIVELMISQ